MCHCTEYKLSALQVTVGYRRKIHSNLRHSSS